MSGAHDGHLDHAGDVVEGDHGNAATLQPHLIRQQDAERRGAERDVGGLIERRVVEHHQPMPGDQKERAGRIVLEPHPSRPVEPGGALALLPVGRDLQEARLQRVNRVQIGLDAREIGLILRTESDRRLRPRGERCERQQGEGGEQSGVGSFTGCGDGKGGLEGSAQALAAEARSPY